MKPIIFNTVMVEQILAGNKTQTRRVIKLPSKSESWKLMFENHPETMYKLAVDKAPYQVGDIVYVRERWCEGLNKFFYYAFGGYEGMFDMKWKPSIHMPKEAARIFLKVTDIGVERVQDISEEDAKAEGVMSYWAEPHKNVAPFIGAAKEIGEDLCSTRREAYRQLWDNIYATKGYGWDKNPWVLKIVFERVERPNE